MKALLTLTFCLLIGTLAQAQDRVPESKVEAIQMEVVQVQDIRIAGLKEQTQVARLYRRSGSRVNKELNFLTKKSRGIA